MAKVERLNVEQLSQLFVALDEHLGQMFYNHRMTRDSTSKVFRTFDPKAELEITERNLPHWLQIGSAMFVTFRTADSLPQDVLLRWRRELEHWLTSNGLPLDLASSTAIQKSMQHDKLLDALSAPQRSEFKKLSDRFFHRSLDECHGKCLLKRPELAKIVGDAVVFYDEDKYDLDRFVVMPNHVHAIVQFRTGGLLDVVSQSWMRYTARQINAATGFSGVFWQAEPFDHIIRSIEQFEYLRHYIFDNPGKANLRTGEFLYWDWST